jgi:4-aminobutyrate aminotransferase
MNDFNTRFSEVLAPVIGYDTDIPIVGSDGSWVTDADGNRYLDFTCGIAVSNLGHQHPHVKAAILDQVDRVWHAGGAFKYESKILAAERLRQVTPAGIDQFLFMNSGAEAVEASVKLARKTSGRQGIIVFRGGFHGRTMGSVTYTTSKSRYRTGYHPLVPSVFVAPFPHPYRWGMTQEEANAYALEELRLLFKHEVTPAEVAAFLVEPMQGEGGYYPGGAAFMHALRALADEHGILLIADEVQTGFGRTGDWFTCQVYDVRPDILVMGKAIANGFPLSAVGAGRELFGQWPPGSHGTTFGGNPVACAACAATVEALADVLPQVDKLSEHALERLDDLQQRHRRIGDVRGMGLMIGIELADEDRTPRPDWLTEVRRDALERGMLLLSCGPDENVMRFLPPLNATIDELDQGIDIIDQSFAATED